MTTTETESLTLTRPPDISDARWATITTAAHMVLTGHAPWCTDHKDDVGESEGWCHASFTAFCADVELTTGSTDGRAIISMYLGNGVDDENLSVQEALAIASSLEFAARVATRANLTLGMPS